MLSLSKHEAGFFSILSEATASPPPLPWCSGSRIRLHDTFAEVL
jgi:hypothetical protein